MSQKREMAAAVGGKQGQCKVPEKLLAHLKAANAEILETNPKLLECVASNKVLLTFPSYSDGKMHL